MSLLGHCFFNLNKRYDFFSIGKLEYSYLFTGLGKLNETFIIEGACRKQYFANKSEQITSQAFEINVHEFP